MAKIQLLTTPAKIKALKPCLRRWKVYRDAHPGPMDKPHPFLDILDSNGIDDARWVLGALVFRFPPSHPASTDIALNVDDYFYRELDKGQGGELWETQAHWDARCTRALRRAVARAERDEEKRRRNGAA